MAARIFVSAQARLLDIWDYTERTWGTRQADAYLRGLAAAINKAQTSRSLWRSVGDEQLPGVFYFHHRHHFIFFRQLSTEEIGVISVLHESMDLPARLREDAATLED
ncbi:plasmid stabilization protein [Spartobacteria bacterium LR76]|nr:plasmid stabilization protein [Spartobacteria bacterium LR76]